MNWPADFTFSKEDDIKTVSQKPPEGKKVKLFIKGSLLK